MSSRAFFARLFASTSMNNESDFVMLPPPHPSWFGRVHKKRTRTRQFPLAGGGISLIGPNRPQIYLDVSPNRSDDCDDRNPVKEKTMSENAIESENTSKPASDTAKAKGARKPAKKSKPAKKVGRHRQR
jgi:hypothetical protein